MRGQDMYDTAEAMETNECLKSQSELEDGGISLEQWEKVNRVLFRFKTGREEMLQDPDTYAVASNDFLDAIATGHIARELLDILDLVVEEGTV